MTPVSEKQSAADVYRNLDVALSPHIFFKDAETASMMCKVAELDKQELFVEVAEALPKWTYKDYFEDWPMSQNYSKSVHEFLALSETWEEFLEHHAKACSDERSREKASAESSTETHVCQAASSVSTEQVLGDAEGQSEGSLGDQPIATGRYVPKNLFTEA
jgi:hypothetical protein